MESRLMTNRDTLSKTLLKAGALILSVLILCTCFPAHAEGEPEAASLELVLPDEKDGYAWRLTDDDPDSRISFEAGAEFSVSVPENTPALFLEWYTLPDEVFVTQISGTGETLSESILAGRYEDLLMLDPACTDIRITSQTPFSLSEIRACSEKESRDYQPLTVPDKADILFILAHTGDETLIFPGLDAKYAGAEGLQTVHLYMSAKNRTQIRETIRMLRNSGNLVQPIILGYRYYFLDMKFIRYKAKFWDKKQTKSDLTAEIRRLRPEVVISHSAEGDLSDGMSVFISEMTLESVKNAASKKEDRKSFASYGTWDVSKVYLHAENGGRTIKPAIDEVSPQSPGGLTYRDIAAEGLSCYKTLSVFRYDITDTNPALSLVKSSVGPDTDGADIMDRIDPERLTNKGIAPAPPEPKQEELQSEPEPVEAPAAEPEPEELPAEQPSEQTDEVVQEQSAKKKIPSLRLLLMGTAALFLLSLILLIVLRILKGRLSPVMLVLTVIFAAAAAMLAGISFASGIFSKSDSTLSESVPASVGSAPLPEKETVPDTDTTAEPAEEEKEEEEPPAEDPNAVYFNFNGGEEIVADPDAGHWEYKTDSLSILIDKTATSNANGQPIVYYVAHIRMNGSDSYRSGFGYFNEEGSAKAKPYEIARRYKAVLAITGDNLVNADVRNKGVLIRNGRLYSAGNRKTPTMAFHSDLSISIYDPSVTAETILEDGVQDSYGFGPILVENGEANPELYHHRLNRANPRCGLGMVEPGHYVAIVGDGRQPNHSVGMSLVEFADLFVQQGCSVAYNMDGGVSAGMVFMGEHINRHRSSHTGRVSAQRPWPDALMFGYSELVPSVDDPIINTGNGNEADRNRKKMEEKNADG